MTQGFESSPMPEAVMVTTSQAARADSWVAMMPVSVSSTLPQGTGFERRRYSISVSILRPNLPLEVFP